MARPQRRVPVSKAMIVAPQPEAARAGAEMLATGGNALDAVLATALVQGVVDPIMCGIGGFGILHVYDPATGRQIVWSGLSECPRAASADMWSDRYIGETADGFGFVVRDSVNECGATAVAVPGILDVFTKAHQALGKMTWADLFEPAIAVAKEGWLVRSHVYTVLIQDERKYGRMNYGEKLALTKGGRTLYLDAEGLPKKPGSRVENPDLAAVLGMVGRDGADALFRGLLGRQIVDDMQRHGGCMSLEDLDAYAAEQQAPIDVSYRGRRFSTVPPPGGGVYVAQLLRVLERFDLVELGHNSAEYIRVLTEAMKIAGRDREERGGDPRFHGGGLDELLSDEYADRCADRIRHGVKSDLSRDRGAESRHTTHVSCVDRGGMVVSLTHTLGNPSGFIVRDTGMMLNGAMASFDPRPGRVQSIAPGKRRSSTMCPSIVFEGDQAVMTLGAPGASWIGPGVSQVLLNVLDWGMGMQEAVMAGRAVATSNAIDISNQIPVSVERELGSMGYEVRRSHLTYAFAGVHGITMFDGMLEGGADPQRDGMAISIP